MIYQPERSVLLHGGGIPVTVPRAERYAVHKLIVAAGRKDQVKSSKDVLQAGMLITAVSTRRPVERAAAWATLGRKAPAGGRSWKVGAPGFEPDEEAALQRVIERRKETGKRRSMTST